MKSFTEFMESRGHKVIASKLKDVESKGSFSYPTPEERRAQIARQKELENKKKTAVKESDELGESSSESHGIGDLVKLHKPIKGHQYGQVSGFVLDKNHTTPHLEGSKVSHTVIKLKKSPLYTNDYGDTVNLERKHFKKVTNKERGQEITSHMGGKVHESEELDEASQEHEYVMQSLANKDINSSIKDGKVVVHKDNLSKAKSHLKKIGHGDLQVVHEDVEEIEEAKAPKLEGRSPAHVKKYALAMGWDHKGGGSHDKLSHPDHPLPLEIPRHKGDLPLGTLKQLQNRIELKDLHKVNHIRHKNKINDSFEIKSFKDYLTESVEVAKVEETTEEQDFEMMLEGIDSRLAKHIRHLRDSGHKVVVTSKSKDGNSAKFISTDSHGNRKLHTITANGIVHKRIEDDKPLSITKAEEPQKRGRGRPAGSKSGANVKV